MLAKPHGLLSVSSSRREDNNEDEVNNSNLDIDSVADETDAGIDTDELLDANLITEISTFVMCSSIASCSYFCYLDVVHNTSLPHVRIFVIAMLLCITPVCPFCTVHVIYKVYPYNSSSCAARFPRVRIFL